MRSIVSFHNLFVIFSSLIFLEQGHCFAPARSLVLELESGHHVDICNVRVKSWACKKSVRSFYDPRTNRGQSHTLDRKDCLRDNRGPMNDPVPHPQSDVVCRQMIEDCPLPRDTIKCNPQWYYGYAITTCKAYQRHAYMFSERLHQHPVSLQTVHLSTSSACLEDLKKCLEAKASIPETMKVRDGLSSSRFKSNHKSCSQWHLYDSEITSTSCSARLELTYNDVSFTQSRPVLKRPENQESECSRS